ncbi:MAG: hypothetical protein Q7V17_03445 [Afipia sp.]|nr:hypothetical protein [Afipia sp.]
MRVLITNLILANHTGTELLVEQTAWWLRKAGHTPVIYAPYVGEVGMRMRRRGHLVFDRISHIGIPPDVIHGHHTGPTMTALAAFPDVPAMFVMHSAAEFDRPPCHPNIRRYFSVSSFLRESWSTPEVPIERFEILGNPVDTDLLSLRPALPPRPATALIVAKLPTQLEAIRAACANRGLKLKEVGWGVDRVSDDLPALFQRADIVFASGRSAFEAMTSGCAVVLTEGAGTFGMVTAETIDQIIDLNGSSRLMSRRPTTQTLTDAIDSYDPRNAALVTQRVRDVNSLDVHGERLLAIYEDLRTSGPVKGNDGMALANFIEAYVPGFGFDQWCALIRHLPARPIMPLSRPALLNPAAGHDDDLGNGFNDIETLRKHLNARMNSRSWRITSPLRGLKRMITSLRA